MTDGPLLVYRTRRHTGTLTADPPQEYAAERLQALHNALKDYQPSANGGGGWRARLGLSRRSDPAPQGLYLYGEVGRGKSMLMDLFFATAPVERKRRVHFHAFMLEVHARLHEGRTRKANGASAANGAGRDDGDPVPALAQHIAEEAWLLCFDEFHVTDIADAMILSRLFRALFDLGVVVVATSNWPPDELYRDGLQRDRFLPFIALVKERLDVLELSGSVDHRQARLKGRAVYHWPLGPAAARALAQAFADLTDGAEAGPTALTVLGRRVAVPRAAKGVAWFRFAELCERPLGAADYLAIATHFQTVIIDGVPRFAAERRDEAKRFIVLIDSLYEHKVNTIIAAVAPPEGLYEGGPLGFEFRRTASRLIEMQAEDYLAAPHLT